MIRLKQRCLKGGKNGPFSTPPPYQRLGWGVPPVTALVQRRTITNTYHPRILPPPMGNVGGKIGNLLALSSGRPSKVQPDRHPERTREGSGSNVVERRSFARTLRMTIRYC